MTLINILSLFVGSAGITSLVIFLIQRRDEKKEKKDEFKEQLANVLSKLEKYEKDNCRTQLLLMIANYGDNVSGILTLAEHYFVVCSGNWFVDPIFQDWLASRGLPTPSWFRNHGE